MEYKNIVKDFSTRTRNNLHLLRELQTTDQDLEIYEVTQLINSMLGLLVFPQRKYVDEIPKIPLDNLQALGLPIPRVIGNFPQVRDLHALIRYLRNAIPHFNIRFITDEQMEIPGL